VLAFRTFGQVDKVREQPNDEYGQRHAENDYHCAHLKRLKWGALVIQYSFRLMWLVLEVLHPGEGQRSRTFALIVEETQIVKEMR